jgi:hypothetical protein
VGADDGMRGKCYDAIAKYSAQLDYSEAHFWNENHLHLSWIDYHSSVEWLGNS